MHDEACEGLIGFDILLDGGVDQVQPHGQEGDIANLWNRRLAIPVLETLSGRIRHPMQRVQQPGQCRQHPSTPVHLPSSTA